MTTPFTILVSLAGLSHREASEFLCVRLDTIRSWSSGRNRCPDGALDDLKKLILKQARTASEALDQISRLETSHGLPEAVELGEPLDDDDAQSIGWPCLGAWRGMAARVIAEAPKGIVIAIVPRGSTPATAAARAFNPALKAL